jgi:hypothetical protein
VECFGYFLRSSAAARNSTNHGLINSDSPSHTFVNTVEHRDGDEQVLSIVIWALISVAHLASAGAEFTHPPELFRTVQPPFRQGSNIYVNGFGQDISRTFNAAAPKAGVNAPSKCWLLAR